LSKPGQSLFNSGNDNAQVSLEATLEKNGSLVWTRGFTGYAKGAACTEAVDKVREALQDAVDALRADVVSTAP
jgi:hypothetical protein